MSIPRGDMRAEFQLVPRADLQNLRWMVHRLVPHLEWRHSGLGVLQAYVREGAEDELRVHVWHPSLAAPGIDKAGDVHDHRFDLESTVLHGFLEHVEHEFTESSRGTWRMHDVVHARLALELTGSHHLVGHEDPRRFDVTIRRSTVSSGWRYRFPRRHFHRTVFGGLVVTLVRKSRQEASPPARVAWPASLPLAHAFESPQPRESWQPLLEIVSSVLAT